MSRFNSPEEVKVWALKAASGDYQRHLEFGVGLNPFCTEGARNDWQRGFEGKGPRPYETSVDYDTMYQRGAAARIIKDTAEGQGNP